VLLLDRLLQADTFIIGNTRPEDTRRDTPLASRYLKDLNYLLCDSKGLLCNVLAQDYEIDEALLRASVVDTFAKAEGLQHIAQYVRVLLQHRPHDQSLGSKLVPCVSTASVISGFALSSRPPSVIQFPRYLVEIFLIVNEPLQRSLDSQLDPLLADKRRDIVDSLTKIVIHATRLDVEVAEELFEKIVGKPVADLKDYYGELVAIVWRMKLMKEYFTKGRMDLRIQGVDQLHAELVLFFQQHKTPDLNDIRSETVSPVLEYLADILLEEKIIEYIVSVESHPQLITRSYNIVGFLVVTNKFSAEQADVVWKTVLTSPDPRVVSATLFMLQNIIRNLTKFKEDVYLCKKLMDSPLPSMSPEAHSFFQEFLNVTRTRYRNYPGNLESNLLPPKLCIRLMKQLSPTKSQGSGLMVNIYAEAAQTLSCLAEQMPQEERILLYQQCVDTLQSASEDAAASVHAIQNIMKNCHGDPLYLATELGIIPALMDEFCVFVRRTKSTKPISQTTPFLEELVPRLDLLLDMILLERAVIQKEHTRTLWDHLVGEDAIGSAARDIAWQRLAVFANIRRLSNPFLDRCYTEFLPSITADHFTPCFFEFVQNLTKYKMQAEASHTFEGNAGQDFGIDLVWRVILTAHPNTGEDSAMQFLAGVYLDKALVQRMSDESVEATHTLLVDSCLERLKNAHARLRTPKISNANSDEDAMKMGQTESERPNQELVFRRTMSFLTMFLRAIRKRSDFDLQAPQLASDIPKAAPVIRGKPITIKYQIHKGGIPPSTKEFVVGDLETRKEFHGRVVQIVGAHGLSSFRIIWSGTHLNLLDHPMETLGKMGLSKAPLIIREPAHNDPLADHVPPSNQPRTAFEKQIVAQFQDLYELMDNDDMLSKSVIYHICSQVLLSC
jgi:ubiquitin carboxyl-terminal hydrolase 34